MGFASRSAATRYVPQDDDTLESIADREKRAGNQLSAEQIALFNWGTDDPDTIDELLRDELGCYKRGEDKRFVISADVSPRSDLLIPQPFHHGGLPTMRTHVIRVHTEPEPPPQFQACCMIRGVTFEFDKSFIRPEVVEDLGAVEEKLGEHPDAKILIFGHTDKVGDDDYNKRLSERRAKSVHAFITNEVDVWESLYHEESWGLRSIQQILADKGGEFDPGPIDGVDGPQTQGAVKSFQRSKGLADDGIAGPKTREALFEDYMSGKHDLEIEDERFLPPKFMGCGEFNPVVQTEEANEANRRVTFFLVNAERPPRLPCKLGDSAPCVRQSSEPRHRHQETFKCSFYDSLARQCDCEHGQVDVEFGIPALRVPERIASGAETIQIGYDIADPGGGVTAAFFEVLRAEDDELLLSRSLDAAQFTPGSHTLDWDGAIDAHDDFPDDFVTIEHSPYKAKVRLEGSGTASPGEQESEIEVVVKRLAVELAPRDTLKQERDQKVWDQVGALPASDRVQLKLLSNLYAEDGDEMTDNTAFDELEGLWGEGPRIPLVATVFVEDSKGGEAKSGKAMGEAKVLWDYKDPTQRNIPYGLATAKPFIDDALDYDKTDGRPHGGDNNHFDRGGMRDSSLPPDVFASPDAEVQDFPFEVTAGTTRFWAGLGDIVREGDQEAQSGAVFRPGRNAGDNFELRAFVAKNDEHLDVDDEDPPDPLAEQEIGGPFEIWREITLAALFKKSSEVTQAVPNIAGYYGEAFIEVDNQLGAGHTFTKAEYDTAFTAGRAEADTAFAGKLILHCLPTDLPAGVSQYNLPRPPDSVGGKILKFFGDVVDTIADWLGFDTTPDPTTWVATIRAYDDFKKVVKRDKGWNDAQLRTGLRGEGIRSEEHYATKAKNYCKVIAKKITRDEATSDGVTVLQFRHIHSLHEMIGLLGHAVFHKRNRTGFALYNARQDTTGHEIGHCMFLPHAPRIKDGALVDSGGGITPERHDDNERKCLMSYARPRLGFCGLCLLRLRGWDAEEFDEDGPKESKP